VWSFLSSAYISSPAATRGPQRRWLRISHTSHRPNCSDRRDQRRLSPVVGTSCAAAIIDESVLVTRRRYSRRSCPAVAVGLASLTPGSITGASSSTSSTTARQQWSTILRLFHTRPGNAAIAHHVVSGSDRPGPAATVAAARRQASAEQVSVHIAGGQGNRRRNKKGRSPHDSCWSGHPLAC
jgi:hypothetical protein